MNQKRRLTGEQEEGRMEGLRILARIIARQYLEYPELYPAPGGEADGEADGVGKDDTAVNAAVRAGGNTACEEANP